MTYSPTSTYTFGQISALDALTVDAMCSLYTIELGGEGFYAAIADAVDDPRATQLLLRNAVEEAGHARRLARAIAHKLGEPFEPTDAMRTPKPARAPEVLDADFFRVLIAGEASGDEGYQKWADNEDDPEVQRLLRLNGREESLHGRRVAAVLEILGLA